MDLGAAICTPRAPDCPACPLRPGCAAHALGIAADLPVKAAKAARPLRYGMAFWLEAGGDVLLARRPAKGLLGGMLALPTSPWEAGLTPELALRHAPVAGDWRVVGQVRHVFTHFALTLDVAALRLAVRPDAAGIWAAADQLAGLPAVMAKAVRTARASRPRRPR